MGVPPWNLLKLPLSLCNASRRVSTGAFQNFSIPNNPRFSALTA
jgi:hypothetical protein